MHTSAVDSWFMKFGNLRKKYEKIDHIQEDFFFTFSYVIWCAEHVKIYNLASILLRLRDIAAQSRKKRGLLPQII